MIELYGGIETKIITRVFNFLTLFLSLLFMLLFRRDVFESDYRQFFFLSSAMDSLPDAILQCILSHICNARDVACCNCVSKRWKESMIYIKTLYFPRNSLENTSAGESPEEVVKRMVSTVVRLEHLTVYSPFSSSGLASWLSLVGLSLSQLELRLDNLAEEQSYHHQQSPSKLECIGAARNLKCLKLWGVLMPRFPKWDVFENLRTLEMVGVRLEESALIAVLQSCPYLRRFVLLGCEGVRTISIDLPYLEECKLDFYGLGNCSLTLTSSKIVSLEVQGCSWIRVPESQHLRNLSISNSAGNWILKSFLHFSFIGLFFCSRVTYNVIVFFD